MQPWMKLRYFNPPTSLLPSVCKSLLLASLVFQIGCATRSKVPTTAATPSTTGTPAASTENGATPAGNTASTNSEGQVTDNITQFKIEEDSKEPPTQDSELEQIPVEINPNVEKWITYFQGRGRNHMERYLARSTRYEKLMKKVLRDNGVPEDIFYIALIESGFTSHATSHASAVGYWQFIRGTGKRYGLEINRMVDDRRDPVLATQAAAEYFKGLYSMFGSWYLAMASYNVGENRVKREVMKNSTRDFWELVRKKRLPKETMNYVPKYIAAKLIAKDPEKFGFGGIDYMPAIEFEVITVKESINLRVMAEKLNVPYEDFKAYNPKFKGEIAPVRNAALDIRLPVGMTEAGLVAAASSVSDKVEFVADAAETQRYKIRKGDNLSSISRKFRTNVAYLRELNEFSRKTKLKVGRNILVPDRTPLKDRTGPSAVAARKTRIVPLNQVTGGEIRDKGSKFYVVQSGDSLYTIAQKYNTSVNELKKLNKLRKGRLIRVGLKLKVPGEFGKERETSDGKGTSKRANVKKFHVVRRGESLIQIAQKYDVTLSTLKKKNSIKNGEKILAGVKLVIR